MTSRPLFLKLLLIDALAVLGLAAVAAAYGHRLVGPSLVAVPAILIVYTAASAYAALLAWHTPGRALWVAHRLDFLPFAAWSCQILGIMATVFGFWVLLTSSGDAEALGARIQDGGGVALAGTFVGVACSLVLSVQERLIAHSLVVQMSSESNCRCQ